MDNVLRLELKNMTQGNKMITALVASKPMNKVFQDARLRELIRFHPGKNINGFEYFVVRHNVFKKRSLYFKTKNNKEDDISYTTCIRSLFGYDRVKDSTVTHAFRNAIYRTARGDFYHIHTDRVCQMCDSRTLVEVDHHGTPFHQIMNDFLKLNNFKDILTVESEPLLHMLVDQEISKKWIEYHDRVATFRYLCKSCNCSHS